MKLVKPSAEILFITPDALKLIEKAGRLCYKSEDKITEDSAPKFVEMILKRGHESVIEHANATVQIVCDRGISHEIVRHRLGSYSQESTRYCDYEGGHVCFVIPDWVDIAEGIYSNWTALFNGDGKWLTAMLNAENSYKELRNEGWRPEQARSVLPNSLKTEITVTFNFRQWRHFFKLRTAKAAHPQMREIAIPLLEEFKKRIPILFDDINT